jgi:23S rRNA (pseudouridine1915-N3)-methyltransferase
MKLAVIAFGKLRSKELAAVADDYAGRLKHYAPTEVVELRDERGADAPSRAKEAGRLKDALRDDDFVVLLDERGKQLASPELANFLAERTRAGRGRTVLVIGGPYGVDDSIRRRANLMLSLSKMTLPHELARAVLLEQLYRACTILRGEKYHHG